MNTDQLPKAFDPHSVEQPMYEHWEKQGYFEPFGDGPPYCIMIPPPNVTGSLHMGHAFQNTLMDALIRYHRMKGHKTLWQAGSDHAGIATQMVVERRLNAEGVSRHDLGREKFIDEIWKWKEHSGGTIQRQLRRLGASLDWSRERFTMDPDLSNAVQEVFVSLYEEGLIYRGQRLVNWDPVLLTAISDLEVQAEEENGHLWHFRYPIADSTEYLVIATTRPETMLGDTAVAVNPSDERYAAFVGKTVILPLVGRPIPIIADDYVDPEFGTGCVKITPAHDFNDYQVGQRGNLDVINIMTPTATIDLPDTPYHGLDRFEARKKVVEDLNALGLLEATENHTYKVPRGDRTGVVIEPYLTDQWFVRTGPLGKPATEVVKNREIRFVPTNWERTYFDWMNDLQDWCISRQIWWGHRIPAWYDDEGHIYVARSEEEAYKQAQVKHNGESIKLRQDEDVLDTWFSSALWPFSTLGWPQQTEDLKTFYTTSVLITGFDIIFFWVARMIMFGLKFADGIPFDEVYIHGLVRDSEGQKMSKSKGNILDPLDLIDGIELPELIEKRTTGLMQPDLAPKIEKATRQQFPNGIPSYGTDALRFTFASLATQGRDIRFDLGRIEGYRNFCNKLWNAARFVLMNRGDAVLDQDINLSDLGTSERWIISELRQTTLLVEEAFSTYRFDIAAKHLHQFIWGEYCDWYIELAKIKLRSCSDYEQTQIRNALLYVLESTLRLLHPIMPFITEEIWQKIPLKRNGENEHHSIMLQLYSSAGDSEVDTGAVSEINWVKEVVSQIRTVRGEMDVNPGAKLQATYFNASAMDQVYMKQNLDLILGLAKLKSLESCSNPDAPDDCAVVLIDSMKIYIEIEREGQTEDQLMRLNRDLAETAKLVNVSQGKLSNANFVERAPAEIVQRERDRLEDHLKKQAELEAIKARLSPQ